MQRAHTLDIQLVFQQVGVFFYHFLVFSAAQGKSSLLQRLAYSAARFIAGCQAKRCQLHHQGHLAVQFFIDQAFVILRPVCQVNGGRRIRLKGAHQVLVQLIRNKRHGRREQLA